MWRRLAILFVVTFHSICGSCLTGNDLLLDCTTAIKLSDNNGYPLRLVDQYDEVMNTAQCYSYITAVNDYNQDFILAKLKGSNTFCFPYNITQAQSARVLVKYLKDNPSSLNLPAHHLAIAAFYSAYPCNS